MNDLTPIAAGDFTLRTPGDLLRRGLVSREQAAALGPVAERYSVAVTPAVAALMDPNDGRDPIARQFVPDPAELVSSPEELVDPIGDDVHEAVPGLIHRYPDRVLLKLTSVCAVYCRFCFRRETIGQGQGAMSRSQLAAAVDYVRARPEVWEVIVSGGDPLVVAPRRIDALMTALAAIDHVKVVRFHTRVPVVAPDAVTADLVTALCGSGKTVWLAIHANHPRELTHEARAAILRLSRGGLFLVSQTVLLKSINNDVGTLTALMRALVECGVKPYYLHHPDLAPGTGHFRMSLAEGRALMQALRGRLSGLAQPTYVLDIPGGHGKVPIGPEYVSEREGTCFVEDFSGNRHRYP